MSYAIAAIALAAALSIVIASWKNGISPMPASAPVRRAVAEEVARLGPTGRIAEAGAGWGTLALAIARRNPGRTIVGVENSPVPWLASKLLAVLSGVGERVTFRRGDLYDFPYDEVDLVVCYLYPGAMSRLDGVWKRGLRPGARVVSVGFAIPERRPERVVVCRDVYATKVYVYRYGIDIEVAE
ncbi:class I SAM-dependent methyltransferase [Paenibacillus antri]|uniref:Class I SAM-dependent methyltransferase n=1 Tax=Paenibacillus antri TaxID=2582848 RepID=A0A5R9G0B8_9BACL|nr:class I SAM-dependent methyltransferase [Paenibacillus antri]TLS49752.1 class I SAM-dependent methyltransferase [Paenibacillus antri]